jgi:hypothetical protein
MADTLGLYEEARQLAQDLGYVVREEVLGDLPGGPCMLQGAPHVLLNLEHGVAERLEKLLTAIAVDPRIESEPKSRLLEARLRSLGSQG